MTTHCDRLAIHALVAVLILNFVGCSSGQEPKANFMDQHLHRLISLHSYGLKWPVPMDVVPELFPGDEVGYRVFISGNEEDQGIPRNELVTLVEVNPGDDSGWLDFTQGYLNALPSNLGDPIGTHVFDEAGSYKYHLRVTYWDGEVLEFSSSGFTTILPAPDEVE